MKIKTKQIDVAELRSMIHDILVNSDTFSDLILNPDNDTIKLNNLGQLSVNLNRVYTHVVTTSFVFDKLLTFSNEWVETGISGNDLPSGSYMIQLIIGNSYDEIWTGYLSWVESIGSSLYENGELLLHKAGYKESGSNIFLKTVMDSTSGQLKLMIASDTNFIAANIKFKFIPENIGNITFSAEDLKTLLPSITTINNITNAENAMHANEADKFSSPKAITLTGDITGTASSDGGWSIPTTLKASGVTAGNYGNASNVNESTFTVPYLEINSKGVITKAENKVINVPSISSLPVSGVTAGNYGTAANTEANQFTVPYFTVNNSGVITNASNVTITVPSSGDSAGGVKISNLLTLNANGWDSNTKTQKVTFELDTAKYNIIDITITELESWAAYKVSPITESSTGITFSCETIPTNNLTFKVVSMNVIEDES